MNSPYQDSFGAALICDAKGTVESIIRIPEFLNIQTGDAVTLIFHPGSRDKVKRFFEQIPRHHALFNWEIFLEKDEQELAAFISGTLLDERILLFINNTCISVHQLNKELLFINNEQANTLRSVTKTHYSQPEPSMRNTNAIYEDLTRLNNEMANLQRELSRKNMELQRLNTKKNEFLGMAAHDLRNPLSVIEMFSRLMLDEATKCLTESQQKHLDLIRRSSTAMLQLVEDLLDYSAIESGSLNISRETADLNKIAEEVITLRQPFSQRKHISLKFIPCDDNATLMVDRGKIHQVIDNLVGNAVKYTPQNGEITVGIRQNPNNLLISVRDTGPGIPKDEQKKLFDAYSITSVKATADEKSTGLGLSIVKNIVEAHQGTISVNSETGSGTEFVVTLPIINETSDTGAQINNPETSRDDSDKPKLTRVLVVDDNQVNRKMLSLILKKNGLEVLGADSGDTAVEQVMENTPDLVFMDIRMPGKDGGEATREIRNIPGIKQPVIIGLTAGINDSEIEKYKETGMDEVRKKPLRKNDLEQISSKYFSC